MSDRITEIDIDPREEDGYILADSDLLSYDEWWAEHSANACCATPAQAARNDCACGGYADDLPSGASRLLAHEEPDGETLHERRMQSMADYKPLREE